MTKIINSISSWDQLKPNTQNLTESFAWQPNQIFVHKLVTSNDIVDERLMMLAHRGIIQDPKDVYIYSFVHPDVEFAVSVTSGQLIKGPSNNKVWNSYLDPGKLIINKRFTTSGFSLEKLSSNSLKTIYFLSSGRPVLFKKITEVPCQTISTTIPVVVLPAIGLLWENFRSRLEIPNKLNCTFLQVKRGKAFSLPQIFTKSNYLFEYTMISK